jgi:LPXTG-motif cell wall-anchored protein
MFSRTASHVLITLIAVAALAFPAAAMAGADIPAGSDDTSAIPAKGGDSDESTAPPTDSVPVDDGTTPLPADDDSSSGPVDDDSGSPADDDSSTPPDDSCDGAKVCGGGEDDCAGADAAPSCDPPAEEACPAGDGNVIGGGAPAVGADCGTTVDGGGDTPVLHATQPPVAGGGGELPYTGLPFAWAVALGMGLLFTGTSIFVRIRRRESLAARSAGRTNRYYNHR